MVPQIAVGDRKLTLPDFSHAPLLRSIGKNLVSNQILLPGVLFIGDINQHHQSSTSILFDVIIFRVMWDVTMD